MSKVLKIRKAPRKRRRRKRDQRAERRIGQPRLRVRLKDPFGKVLVLKRALTGIIGLATYPGLAIVNKMKVEGANHLLRLPKRNVLFISNHQTYYADVIALYHIFCSVKWKFRNINFPLYLLVPRVNSYYIAAEETMKESGILPKLFSYAGAVTVKRSWRYKGEDVRRGADFKAPEKIEKALGFGWVITFPQGTTTPEAPVQKGAASIIKAFNPLVVPVEIDGFRKAFGKKGLKLQKRGVRLSVKFKEPMRFGEDASIAEIHEFLENHILGGEDQAEKP